MDNYCWDLEKIYSSEEDYKKDGEKAIALIDKLGKIENNSNSDIYEVIDVTNELNQLIFRMYSFAHMKQDENSKVAESQKRMLEMEGLVSKTMKATSFVAPLLLSYDENKLKEVRANSKYPDYKIEIERILRDKEHMLSKEQEYIISAFGEIGQNSHNSFYMLSNADMKFPVIESSPEKEELTHANFIKFLTSKDRAVRKEAFEKLYSTYKSLENTFASTLFGNIKNTITVSALKKFNNSIEMPLFRDDVSISVYESLISSVHEALPILYKYFELKRKILGIDEFHLYDAYVNISDFDKKIEFEEAKTIVLEALKPLGEDYLSVIKQAFSERWIDVYPREGKRSGAYSGGSYDTAPYILMNYNDNLDSVFTLIHELGHSVHSYYSRKNNEFMYSDYTIFVAEVASTTNEMLLINYLLKKADSKEEKIYLLNHFADMFKSTVFRQTMFAEFEKLTHEMAEKGTAFNAEEFKKVYYDLNKLYFGEKVNVDEEIALEWARIPHFYSDFYVYKYATGLSAATVLSENILSGDKQKLDNYLNFLKDGNKHYPIEQLKSAGADMSKPDTVKSALQKFGSVVEELEKALEE